MAGPNFLSRPPAVSTKHGWLSPEPLGGLLNGNIGYGVRSLRTTLAAWTWRSGSTRSPVAGGSGT